MLEHLASWSSLQYLVALLYLQLAAAAVRLRARLALVPQAVLMAWNALTLMILVVVVNCTSAIRKWIMLGKLVSGEI